MKNKVQLIGNVGQEPETTTLNEGKKVVKFSLATNEVYYNSNGDKVEKTEWHKITAWGKTADLVEKYVEKGMKVAVDGKITYNNYTDKEGNTRNITEIVASELLFLR